MKLITFGRTFFYNGLLFFYKMKNKEKKKPKVHSFYIFESEDDVYGLERVTFVMQKKVGNLFNLECK